MSFFTLDSSPIFNNTERSPGNESISEVYQCTDSDCSKNSIVEEIGLEKFVKVVQKESLNCSCYFNFGNILVTDCQTLVTKARNKTVKISNRKAVKIG